MNLFVNLLHTVYHESKYIPFTFKSRKNLLRDISAICEQNRQLTKTIKRANELDQLGLNWPEFLTRYDLIMKVEKIRDTRSLGWKSPEN